MNEHDIFNIEANQLVNKDSLKLLYVDAVKNSLCENNPYSVLEFFMASKVALSNDKDGTPEKLFAHFIKTKEKRYFTDELECKTEHFISVKEREELVDLAHQRCIELVERTPNGSHSITEEDDSYNLMYASDGAFTWQELLRNTALLAAGEDGQNKLKNIYRNFRQYDEDDRQGQLNFMASSSMVEVSLKDDTSLMDICPFGLSKTPRFKPIHYKLRDSYVNVTGNAEHGMATVFDYDIVIYVATSLNAQMNDLKKRVRSGEKNPILPPRKMRCYTTDVFEFLKIKRGGKQYSNFKDKLRRLKGTQIEIEKIIEGGYRREGSFSLIGDWEIISETKSGKISEISIGIPDWIYDGIVRQSDPTVLTLCDDYMLLKSGYHKFLARIAKKSAGENSWNWTLEQLYERSGSTQPIKDFRCDLLNALKSLKKDPIPEYIFTWREGDRGRPKPLDVRIQPTGMKGRHKIPLKRIG